MEQRQNWDSDGSLVPHAVAHFLYDLLDGPSVSEPWDAASYPGKYIADVIRTCSVSRSNGTIGRARRVDDFIACFQQQNDPAATEKPTYFPEANYLVTSHSVWTDQSGFGWNREDIRRIWKKNLYNVD